MFRAVTGKYIFKKILSYSIESSLDTFSDGFDLTIGNKDGENAGIIVRGSEITLSEDNNTLLVGVIDEVTEGEIVTIDGRDLMVEIIENDAEHQTMHEKKKTIRPSKEIKRLVAELGINKVKITGIASEKPIEKFLPEAGESYADVCLRLAEKGDFNIWMDRLGTLYISKLDFKQVPKFHFYNKLDGSNCGVIKRKQSAANLKSEIWAFSDADWTLKLSKTQIIKAVNEELKNAGINRRKTFIDKDSKTREETQKKVDRMMKRLSMAGKEWLISYGGSHERNGFVPEPGDMAMITSIYSGVKDLRAMIVEVTLKYHNKTGTQTLITLREEA